MEIGAVKQAFNNELILLKRKLNQAKIHVIHKHTRKAKTFMDRKGPEPLKEKFKRKAESAVKEILIIKKIKARDIGKFIVTHSGQLQDFINTPQVDNNKACARLLLHKTMQDKYTFIRSRFGDVPIKDLFMSRQERRKIKKEMRMNQKKNKKKDKDIIENATSEGDWMIEDIGDDNKKLEKEDMNYEDLSDVEIKNSDSENNIKQDFDSDQDSEEDDEESEQEGTSENDTSNEELDNTSKSFSTDSSVKQKENKAIQKRKTLNKKSKEIESKQVKKHKDMSKEVKESELEEDESDDEYEVNCESVKPSTSSINVKHTETKSIQNKKLSNVIIEDKFKIIAKEIEKKQQRRHKDNKNKKLEEKILHRTFKKDLEDVREHNKIVDPFFITSTGENYMSVVEPRQPDEIKEIHRQGNRKERRAAMFGHVPKIKPKPAFIEDHSFNGSDSFNRKSVNTFERKNIFGKKTNQNKDEISKKSYNNKSTWKRNEDVTKPEKLHPSWEAKKRQSGILPFQGKKIVFNDN